MRNLNKYIFTLCLLISCFIFSNKVFAEIVIESDTSGVYKGYAKDLLSEFKVTAGCIEKTNKVNVITDYLYPNEKYSATAIIEGMSACSISNLKLMAHYSDDIIKEEYTNDYKITTRIQESNIVKRIDAWTKTGVGGYSFYNAWSANEHMKDKNGKSVVIIPGMSLEVEFKESTKVNYAPSSKETIKVDKISIERITKYDTSFPNNNQGDRTNMKNYLGLYSVSNFTIALNDNDNSDSNNITYSYIFDTENLSTSDINNHYLGYPGTTEGMYTKNQYSFHYLIPLKETIIYTVSEPLEGASPCNKNPKEMNQQEIDFCCNYPQKIKDGKTFKEINPELCPKNCVEIREENNKQEYLRKNCCAGTDSINASAEWCCENESYLKNNKNKCCTKEKETGYKSSYFPDLLAEKFDEVCCKDETFFDNGGHIDVCCTKEKETGFKGIYFPDIYAFRYDEKCDNPPPPGFDCKNENDFKKNKTFCCAREKANNKTGKYIPNNLNYETAECEPKENGECETDKDVRRNPKTCCQKLKDDGKTDIKLYKDNCLVTIEGKTCDEETEDFTYDSSLPGATSYIKVEDKISFSDYPKKQTIELGTGFEYTVEEITNTTTITTNYSTDLGIMTSENAETYANNVANDINTKVEKLNENIEKTDVSGNSVKYQNQKVYFDFDDSKIDKVKLDGSYVDKLPMLVSWDQTSNKFSMNKVDVTFTYKEGEETKTITKQIYNFTTSSVTNEYKITLPHAYINKNTGDVEYFSTKKTDDEYKRNYYYGGNKFYTNEHDISQTIDFNITITSGGASGNINTSTDDFTCQTDGYNYIDDGISVDPEEIKEGNGYFYRKIALDKPFPSRNAGENWGGSDTRLRSKWIWKNTNLTSTDTTKATSVYSSTPMYEITLTSDLISEIRKYNKSSNYLDWNMNETKCNESNKNECESTSKFLSGETNINDSILNAEFMKGKVKFWGNNNNDNNNRITRYGEDKIIIEVSE